jgi:cyclophilin family peptidyl-prolyl cis-trans isomerase
LQKIFCARPPRHDEINVEGNAEPKQKGQGNDVGKIERQPDENRDFERGKAGKQQRKRLSSGDRRVHQFFICFADARFLDQQYTVWGKVTAGMENVHKIKRGEPVRDPDKIISATVS